MVVGVEYPGPPKVMKVELKMASNWRWSLGFREGFLFEGEMNLPATSEHKKHVEIYNLIFGGMIFF